jgi:hypothetical protein
MKKIKFSDLYTISSGISSTKEQAGHGSPFLSFSTVFNNFFIPDKLEDLMDTSESEQKTYSIKSGDIFLTRTSEVIDELAMSSVALKDYPNATYSGFLKRLRPIDGLKTYPKFMAFYLRTPLFRKTITNNATMTLRASFNETIFSYLDLLLPDYSEQKKIGDFLYLINQKIALNKQINARLEEMAKTLYDYWFVQFDFPDTDGKPYKSSGGEMVFDETLKREIPKGWKPFKLSELVTLSTGKEDANFATEQGIYPFFTCSEKILKCDVYSFDTQAILLAGNGTFSVKRFTGRFNAYQRTYVLEPKSKNLYPIVYFVIIDNVIKFTSGSRGSIIKFITRGDIENIDVVLPNDIENMRFSEVLYTYLLQAELLEKQNHQLTQLRDFLLPMLMNGQVSVTCSGARDG